MPCRLTVNVREFTLTDEHATIVSEDILSTVRDGGGYVHLTPITGPEADVLVTASTTVAFERLRVIQPAPVTGTGIDVDDETWAEHGWPDEYL